MFGSAKRSRQLLSATVLLSTAFVTTRTLALTWGDYDADRHNPFNKHASFIGAGLDLSGVGVFDKGGTNDQWWVTMISDTYFLSAAHISPTLNNSFLPQSYEVRFFHNFADTTPDETAYIDEDYGVTLGNDLFLGRLLSTPSSAVKRYPLIKRNENTNYPSYIDPKIYVVGFGEEGKGYTQTRLGLNDILGLDGNEFRFASSDGHYGDDEAITIYGDSSGPSFVALAYSGLALAGIHHSSGADSSISAHITTLTNVAGAAVATDLPADVNGDYQVDIADFNIISANYGMGPGITYNEGDIDGDGSVTFQDYLIFSPRYGTSLFAPADFNHDQIVDKIDMLQIGSHWHMSVTAHTNGDANGDAYVDGHDLDVLNSNWRFGTFAGANVPGLNLADLDHDGLVAFGDYQLFFPYYGASCPTAESCGGADFNNDGVVGIADYGILFANWNPDGYRPGDLNQDHSINNADLEIILGHWNETTSGGSADGDMNADGVVDVDDFAIMTEWWGAGVTTAQYDQPPLSVIPEPSSLALLAVALFSTSGLFRRRKG